jgi:hypothetical protein
MRGRRLGIWGVSGLDGVDECCDREDAVPLLTVAVRKR